MAGQVRSLGSPCQEDASAPMCLQAASRESGLPSPHQKTWWGRGVIWIDMRLIVLQCNVSYNLACFFLLDLRLTVHHAQLQAIRSWVVQTTLMHHLEPAFSGRSPCVLSFKPSSLWSRATCDATHAPGANGMPLDLPVSPIGVVHCLSSDRSMATGSTATGCTRSSPPPTIFQTLKKLAEKESLAPARFPNRTPKSDPQKPR